MPASSSVVRLHVVLAAALGLSCAAVPDPGAYSVERGLAYGDAPRQRGDLYRPERPGPHPAVLLIHGGAWVRGERSDVAKYAERFAAAGFVVWNVDYRLAPDHVFPAQLEDVRAALAWLGKRSGELEVDPERIAAMGYSAGAHLALLLGLADGSSPRPAAVVSGAGPTDLLAYPESPLIRKLIGGGVEERRDAWEAASPLTHVSPDDPPVVMYHGARDRIVGIEQSRRLHEQLLAAGVESELFEEPWAGHSTAFLFDRDAFAVVLGFLDARLR